MTQGVYIKAYYDRDPAWIFVPDTANRGRYCRVPWWVAHSSCNYSGCGALPGQPCRNPITGNTWSGLQGTHVNRCPTGGQKRMPRPPRDIIDIATPNFNQGENP